MRTGELLIGTSVVAEEIIGVAYVVNQENPIEKFNGGILVIEALSYKDFLYLPFQSRLHGIISENDINQKALGFCREHKIPCLTKCKKATLRINHKELIRLSANPYNTFCESYEGFCQTTQKKKAS